jgi:outer membrane protein TolC
LKVHVLLVLLLAASPAVAQPPSPPPGLSLPASASSFLGGIPTGTRTDTPVTITVIDAIARALQHNLGVLLAEESVGQARGVRYRMLSELMPILNAHVSETRQKINLQAFGFGAPGGPTFPGVPDIVGPFNVFDARVTVSQTIFDLQAQNNARSEAHNVEAARLSYASARDLVINVAGNYYVAALAATARAAAARTQQDTAQALYDQAQDLKKSGIVAGVDVLRAEVQLNVEMQRATASSNEVEKAKLTLARIMGLPLGQPYTLDATLPELPEPDMTPDQAAEAALKARPDYQAAMERVHAAEASRQAVVGEALPSIHVNADFGEIGLTAPDAQGTFAIAGLVSIPIFQGGRVRGRLMEADAELRRRRAEAEDMRASVYYEIRSAFLDLETSRQQLTVATKARDLAAQQLVQARDRFAAGVGSNIEVVQAQESVATTNSQFITSTYGYNLAKGGLIRGMGGSEAVLKQIIGGSR